jgi:2-polyprenyl-6-methoxyphenol hydroxylase-like FAD-dependent oxidoreductase
MSSIHSSAQPPCIAIIGGGPGGLTLASILQKHGIRATVFESEASASSRSQGGSLDLHNESGLEALRVAGLFDDFMKYARYEGQQMRVIDKSGVVHLNKEGPTGPPKEEGNYQGRPEIDRFVFTANFSRPAIFKYLPHFVQKGPASNPS